MNDTAENNLIRIENLTKIYSGAGEKLTVFSDVNVNLKRGSKTVILGESGSGKSTLLALLRLGQCIGRKSASRSLRSYVFG